MITVYSDSSIHKRLIATYPDLVTLAREFKPKFGQVQDFYYVRWEGNATWVVSWTEVQKEIMKNDNQTT